MRGAPPFADIPADTRTNHVFPGVFAPESAGNNVIQTQLMGGIMSAAVLTGVFIPGEYVSSIKVQLLLWQAIERKQANDPGYLNLKIHGENPIFMRLFVIGTQFAHFPPGLECVICKLS